MTDVMTAEADTLFSPLKVGRHTLRNRIINSGHATSPGPDTHNENLLAYEARRVEGGAAVVETAVDGIELHFGHGNLVQQFMSPETHHREDRWGGSAENRNRLAWSILVAVRSGRADATGSLCGSLCLMLWVAAKRYPSDYRLSAISHVPHQKNKMLTDDAH